MWQIRAYRHDDEFAAEQLLVELKSADLERRLGFAPTRLGSTPLGPSELKGLSDLLRLPVDATLDYFLDFDADSQPRVPGRSELHMSA
jgi:hypothetical protein